MNQASPGVLLVALKSSHGCLALVGCTIYPHNPESSQGTLGCKVTTRPLHSRGLFFSFEKVPLLFIEKLTVYECQAHHRWEILLLQLSMFQGNTPSDHEWKKKAEISENVPDEHHLSWKKLISKPTICLACSEIFTTNILNKHLYLPKSLVYPGRNGRKDDTEITF